MTRPRSIMALVAGSALVVAVNAVILGSALMNRTGERLAELTLTERELALPAFREDDSSVLLLSLKLASEPPQSVQRLAWRRRDELPAVAYPWFDRSKLEALGFRLGPDAPPPPDGHDHAKPSERLAFVALEFDGDAWRGWLAAREESLRKRLSPEEADALLALDRTMRSRLVPIDAGNDERELRRRYPDRARHLVVQAIVRAVRNASDAGSVWHGQISTLLVTDIGVPGELAFVLKPFLSKETPAEVLEREQKLKAGTWPAPTPPRYRAVVAFGSRNEPWLVGVSEMPSN